MLKEIIREINEAKKFTFAVELFMSDYANYKKLLKNSKDINVVGELGNQTIEVEVNANNIGEAKEKIMKVFNVSEDNIEIIK